MTFKTIKDRNLNIHVTAAIYWKILEGVGKKTTEMNAFIKNSLEKNELPDISKYVNYVKDLRISLEKDTQIKEIRKLDNFVYCYYIFVESNFKKMKTALLEKDTKKFKKEYTDAVTELSNGIEAVVNPISIEIKNLYDKYPLIN